VDSGDALVETQHDLAHRSLAVQLCQSLRQLLGLLEDHQRGRGEPGELFPLDPHGGGGTTEFWSQELIRHDRTTTTSTRPT
jgi:hypothetical protein